MSAGGLSVHTELEIEQGETVRLHLEAGRRRPAIQLEAIVWHVRTLRSRRSGKTARIMGLVLSDAPDAYVALIDELKPAPPRAAVRAQASSPSGAPSRPRSAPERDAAPPSDPREREPLDACPPAEPAGAEAEPAPAAEPPRPYRVRVKQQGTPYTRSIQVFASSIEAAGEAALAETGAGWAILEIQPA